MPTHLPAAREHYYFIFGNGSLYQDGWSASFSYHPDFFELQDASKGLPTHCEKGFTWSLFNLEADFNERIDLAKQQPERLKAMQAEFDAEAKRCHAYPLLTFKDLYARYDKNRSTLNGLGNRQQR